MPQRAPLHGYNTNYRKQGEVYHVQTEDLGETIGAIVTQVFTGGTILAKKRTEYKDIIGTDNVETKLRELMQKQHKYMLLELRDGKITPESAILAASQPASESNRAVTVKEERPSRAQIAADTLAKLQHDDMRDTVQMEIPPEFYEEIGVDDGGGDGVIIDDFPPPAKETLEAQSGHTSFKPTSRPQPQPPKMTPVPAHSPPPTIKVSTPALKRPIPTVPRPSPPSAPPTTPRKSPRPSVRPAPRKATPRPRASATEARRPRIFSESAHPAPGFGEEQIGERSLDEVILSYLADDLQDDT